MLNALPVVGRDSGSVKRVVRYTGVASSAVQRIRLVRAVCVREEAASRIRVCVTGGEVIFLRRAKTARYDGKTIASVTEGFAVGERRIGRVGNKKAVRSHAYGYATHNIRIVALRQIETVQTSKSRAAYDLGPLVTERIGKLHQETESNLSGNQAIH